MGSGSSGWEAWDKSPGNEWMTPALFSPVELNPGAFTLLVRFVWVGVNTSLKLWCGPNSPLPGSVVVFKADLG